MCLLFAPRAAITSPNDESDELIFFASSKRWPVAPDSLTRSEPAKSTKFKQDSIFWSVRVLWPKIRVRLLSVRKISNSVKTDFLITSGQTTYRVVQKLYTVPLHFLYKVFCICQKFFFRSNLSTKKIVKSFLFLSKAFYW